MKYILSSLFFLLVNSAQALENCENDLSNNYNFTYNYDEKLKILNYQISSKNKKDIIYYDRNYEGFRGIFGINIKNDNHKYEIDPIIDAQYKKNVSKEIYDLDEKYNFFFREKNKFYSSMIFTPSNEGEPSIILPLPDNRFKKSKIIQDEVKIDKFINLIKDIISENVNSGNQKIKFKVKLILDTRLNNCAVFETKEINYDFGNKYFFKIKDFFRKILDFN